ncbi:MAG: toprim domain-containing protein, partial [Planctomycetota bacterium]
APPGWDNLLRSGRERGFLGPLLEEAGLVLWNKEGDGYYDRFRHRVIFPIADLQGRVITFGARALGADETPKYLNGPETPVFKKSNVLYGLDRARESIRKTGEALLMEGYTDVLMCHLHGLDRAVAGMGTAFTSRQAALLSRFARRIVLVYDADEAGRAAAERTMDILLPEGLDVRVAFLPAGRDVDEILLEEGREVVEQILDEARDLLAFKLHVEADRHDLATPQGRARAGEAIVDSVIRIPRPVERDQILRDAAERLGGTGTEKALREEAVRRLRSHAPRRAVSRGPAGSAEGEQEADVPIQRRVFERNQRDAEVFLLAGLILVPDLRGRILRAVAPEDFTAPVLRRVYNAVLCMEESGEPYDLKTLTGRMADDAEAQAALAGLPEDPNLEDRIPWQIEYLESCRKRARRAREILRDLGVAEPAPGADDRARDGRWGEETTPRGSVSSQEQSG